MKKVQHYIRPCAVCIIFLFTFCVGYAQSTDIVQSVDTVQSADTANDPPPQEVEESQVGEVDTFLGAMSKGEFILSLIIIIFSLAILVITNHKKINFEPEQYIRLVTIILIITASLILISAGYDDKQIGGVLGLFGTIVGYLLGSRDTRPKLEPSNTDALGAKADKPILSEKTDEKTKNN